METLKTAFVVVLLLAVLFGVYTVLNKPDAAPPKEVAWLEKAGPDALNLDITTGSDAKQSPGQDTLSAPEKPADKTWNATPSSPPLMSDPSKPGQPSDRGSPSLDPQRGLPTAPVPVPDLTSGANPSNGGTSALNDNNKSGPSRYEWPPAGDTRKRGSLNPDPGANAGTSRLADNPGDRMRESPLPPSNLRSSNADSVDRGQGAVSPGRNSTILPAGNVANDGPTIQPNPYFDKTKTDSGAGSANGASRYAKYSNFDRTRAAAQEQINNKQWREALVTLSQIYGEPSLTTAERDKLLDLLDPLAAKVVYSTEHLIEPAYVAQRGDTLITVANQYGVPYQLLQNINSIRNPEVLLPGTQLKVVRGPFRAEVDLTGKELTLFVQRMYAGRFPISVGNDPMPTPGEYEVRNKELGHAFFGRDGQNIAAGDPRNPFGRCWIDLGKEVCIHGSSAVDNGPGAQGCVGLSPQDANDVLGILSQGSKVLIRR